MGLKGTGLHSMGKENNATSRDTGTREPGGDFRTLAWHTVFRAALVAAVLGALATSIPTTVAQASSSPVPQAPVPQAPVPQAPVTLPTALDPVLTIDQYASVCDPTPKPGLVAFRTLVLATYPGTEDFGIVRECNVGGSSEHKEGRAWDWGVSVTNPAQVAQVQTLLSWLTASDSLSRRGAMARRVGILYIIWDDHIWSPGRAAEGWRPYVHAACRTITPDKCPTALRHRDHVHFSFTKPGAARQTSFWTGKVAETVASTPTPSPSSKPTATPSPSPSSKPTATPSPTPAVSPASGSSPVTTRKPVPTPTSLTVFYATTVRPDQSGPAVRALQKALRMPAVTGWYGPVTWKATVAFQKKQRLDATGVVTRPTWKALQREINRHAALINTVTHVVLHSAARHPRAVPILEAALRRPVDQIFDAASGTSVKAFQRAHDLPVTGIVDYRTWQALRRL